MKFSDFVPLKIVSVQKKLLLICLIWAIGFTGTAYFMIQEAEGFAHILQDNNSDSSLLLNQVLLLGLISLAGMSLMVLAFTRSVIRPLRALIQTTNALTSGILKTRTEVVVGDEIAHLSEAFNRMAATLDETHASKGVLKKSEERFRKIFLHSNEAIFLINPEEGDIKEANTSACGMLGFTREILLSKPCSDIYPNDMPALQAFFEGVYKDGNGWSDELLCRTKSGEMLSTELSASKIEISGTPYINALVRDISDRRKSGKWLGVASTVMKSTQEGIIVSDAERKIQGVNPAFTRVTGYAEKEVIGKNARILKSGLQETSFYEKMWAAIHEKGAWKGEVWNRRKDGEIYPEGLAINAIKNHQGEVTNYVAIFSDLTVHNRQGGQHTHGLFHDTLTGIPNRVLFQDRLRQAIAQVGRSRRMLALLFLGLGGLKPMSNILDPSKGDILLRSVAGRLKRSIRSSDPVSRVGGNEFAIILSDAATTLDIEGVAKKILHTLSQPFSLDSHTISINTNIGISFYPFASKEVDTLITQAYTAMCLSKKEGENRYQIAKKPSIMP